VGVLAEVVRRFGGSEIFQFQTLVVLLGAAGLAVLLLSDRLRQKMHLFVARHFRKAQHDSVQIWSLFSRELSRVRDEAGLTATSARLVAETLDVLSVSVWLFDATHEQLVMAASTAPRAESAPGGDAQGVMPRTVATALYGRSQPFDLDDEAEPWAEEMRQHNPSGFANGGHRLCVPLRAGDVRVGVLVLADRVNGLPYTVEELELLRCIAKQATATLLTLRLSQEVAQARELEAFRTMSAFFVHDLKNAAASLNLMLKNLPVHFNDPAFREDALRGVGNTARRIDGMIARLSALRQRPRFTAVPTDLNDVVRRGLEGVEGLSHVALTRDLSPLPTIQVDREQMQSVVSNLVLNARDALGAAGTIRVRTEHDAGRVVLSVSDDGCGMSEAFVKQSLFRPFQSTKKDGLGIGMFQCRLMVEAHGGSIQVESQEGVGTTFRVSLPVPRES